MNTKTLNPNALAFIALCNEYCSALENVREFERTDFVRSMLRLLPRIYMSASDLDVDVDDTDDPYIEPALEEDYYESVRRGIEALMGPEDTYLEVFEEDMKYSDTPIAASISESLTDIFQVLYNFVEMIKDAPDYIVKLSVQAVKDDFGSYWSQILCNVMRALNQVRYSTEDTIV